MKHILVCAIYFFFLVTLVLIWTLKPTHLILPKCSVITLIYCWLLAAVLTKGRRASDMHSIQANSPSVAYNSAPDPPMLQRALLHTDEDCLGKWEKTELTFSHLDSKQKAVKVIYFQHLRKHIKAENTKKNQFKSIFLFRWLYHFYRSWQNNVGRRTLTLNFQAVVIICCLGGKQNPNSARKSFWNMTSDVCTYSWTTRWGISKPQAPVFFLSQGLGGYHFKRRTPTEPKEN